MSVFTDVHRFNTETGLNEVELTDEQAFSIISEEVFELLAAQGDRVLQADAFIDIVFATLSCATRRGFPMDDLWEEVMVSNMSKVGAPIVDGKLQKGENFVEPDFAGVLGV